MRYALTDSPHSGIALPRELADALGDPREVEVERVSGGLLLKGANGTVREPAPGTLEAIEATRARLRSLPGLTPEKQAAAEREEAEALAVGKAVGAREDAEILTLFDHGHVSP
jgi:hypothetical protein